MVQHHDRSSSNITQTSHCLTRYKVQNTLHYGILNGEDRQDWAGGAFNAMIYILMGVSGCGKSSLGALLSEKLGWPLYEGDDFHPQGNIDKMTRGEPLTDQDRFPWLLRLHDVIEREGCCGGNALVACSALKRLYRQILLHGSRALGSSHHQDAAHPPILLPPASPDVCFLFLHGDYNLIYQRLASRKGHYMMANLLRSQFDALEPPSDEENVLPLDITLMSITDMTLEVEKHLTSHKKLLAK